MKRLAAVATALAMVLALAGGPASPASGDEHEPRLAAQRLLDAQVDAIAARDKAAYMATFDPRAPEAFRSAQGVSFDGLTTLPLTDHRLTVRLDDSGDLAAGLDLARVHDAGRAFLPETRRSYRLGDYDERVDIDSLWWTYVQRDGRWYVAADDDLADIGLTTNKELWDFGPVVAIESGSFLVLAKPDHQSRAREVAAVAEEAMARFRREWPGQWSGRIPLVIPGSASEASILLRTSIDVANFVAFVAYTPVRESGTWTTTAPRIFVQYDNFARSAPARQVGDLVHELTHAAASNLSGPFTPVWLHEGLAEYMRMGQPTNVPVPGNRGDRLPSNADFAGGDRNRVSAAYAQAASAVSYLARVKGPSAPLDVFTAVGARRFEPGSVAHNVNAGLQAGAGMSVAELERGWLGG